MAVRLHPDDRVTAADIERLAIAVSGSNVMVPLDQIARVTMSKGPATIQHTDGKRVITVSANAQGRSPGEVTADALKIANKIDFPTGFGIRLDGAADLLKSARSVVITPGYGMAVAQAQYPVADLTKKLRERGILAGAAGPASVRLVTHADVGDADVDRCVAAFRESAGAA